MDEKTSSEKTSAAALLQLGSVFTVYWVILYEQPLRFVCLLKWEVMTSVWLFILLKSLKPIKTFNQ